MKYSVSDIDKIVNFKTWSDKQKIDELLRIDTMIYPNLGIDQASKKKDKHKVYQNKYIDQ